MVRLTATLTPTLTPTLTLILTLTLTRFADTCKKFPNLDKDPTLGVETGLLDLSFQVKQP